MCVCVCVCECVYVCEVCVCVCVCVCMCVCVCVCMCMCMCIRRKNNDKLELYVSRIKDLIIDLNNMNNYVLHKIIIYYTSLIKFMLLHNELLIHMQEL